jgi:hypothetical protein
MALRFLLLCQAVTEDCMDVLKECVCERGDPLRVELLFQSEPWRWTNQAHDTETLQAPAMPAPLQIRFLAFGHLARLQWQHFYVRAILIAEHQHSDCRVKG